MSGICISDLKSVKFYRTTNLVFVLFFSVNYARRVWNMIVIHWYISLLQMFKIILYKMNVIFGFKITFFIWTFYFYWVMNLWSMKACIYSACSWFIGMMGRIYRIKNCVFTDILQWLYLTILYILALPKKSKNTVSANIKHSRYFH